ncbi:unnamed protein product [Litomosoides sigmodontis]|uniref:Uncharacterized protein n=1 Tax=Litomosoides sigmodontis TaxID=42156 RepID=A0A3P7KH39_LITSI|nr:unnamed protein product [Litomosoides sigmodontis]
MHMGDLKSLFQRLSQVQSKNESTNSHEKVPVAHQANVNLPQLPLTTFSGNTKQWRGFWSSLDAAIHQQAIPEMQKLNYLIASLKGDALLAVRGYDVAPENYEVIRRLLIEKHGQIHTLFNELLSIKRNDREWKATIEAIERMLRQLEAIGENLEHSSIENLSENKLPT